jgi:hypothetical protein
MACSTGSASAKRIDLLTIRPIVDNRQMNRIRVALIFATVVASAAMFSTSAPAATLVGLPLDDGLPDASQPGTTVTQRRNADVTGAIYGGFPSGGVLTSLSVETTGIAGTVSVSVLRKTGTPIGPDWEKFISTAQTEIPVTADATVEGHVTTVATKIPVIAGDRIGATSPAAGTNYLRVFVSPDDNHCYFNIFPHAVGATANYDSVSCNDYLPQVQGTLEPDADGDGAGDETQDLCPTDSTRQTPCPGPSLLPANLVITAVKSTAKAAATATRSFKVRNIGGTTGSPVTVALSSSKKIKKISFLKGCTAAKKGTCTIGKLDPGMTTTVKIKVTPKTSSSTKLTAKVNTPGEIATSDNSAKTTVKFKLKK